MSRRLQTTKERAVSLIRAAIGECHAWEEVDGESAAVSILAEPPPCRGFIPVVTASGKTLNDAWANAMDDAWERASSEVLRFDREVAQAEIAKDTETPDAMLDRAKRRTRALVALASFARPTR